MQELLAWLESYPYLFALFIVLARIVDVSVGTMRTIAVVRGFRSLAVALALIEVLVWVTTVSGVLASPTVLKIAAYAVGFAAGNAAGIALENRIALGLRMVIIISDARQQSVAFALRLAGYAVTEVPARGHGGDVAMCFAVVSRRKIPAVERVVASVDPDAFVTVQEASSSTFCKQLGVAHQPTGWRAIVKKK